MPYSGPDDEKLPPHVQALPRERRERWVAVWNGAFDDCRSDGGNVSECEGRAFRAANGVVNKARHRRDKCMQCNRRPGVEVLWANGHAHAWFCRAHYSTWAEEHSGDVDAERELRYGVASKRWGDGPPTKAQAERYHRSIRKDSATLALKQDPVRNGVMVAFMLPPEVAEHLAIPGGVRPENLHITMAYLGDREDMADSQLRAIAEAVQFAAQSWPWPIPVTISGTGRFEDVGGEQREDAIYAAVDSPDLMRLRQALEDMLGPQIASEHAFRPHVTLAYIPHGADSPVDVIGHHSVVFDSIQLVVGPRVVDYPLSAANEPVNLMGDNVPEALDKAPFTPRALDLRDADEVQGGFGEMCGACAFYVRDRVDTVIGSCLLMDESVRVRWSNTSRGFIDARRDAITRFAKVRPDRAGEDGEEPDGPDVPADALPMLASKTIKADEEKRYTFGVVYRATNDPESPELDAHDEYLTADDLQQSLWEYVRDGNRAIYLQHGHVRGIGFKRAGEWVEITSWPFEVEAEFTLPNGEKRSDTVPAGSVWMGVIWDRWAWPHVKAARIRGFSFGGVAHRVPA